MKKLLFCFLLYFVPVSAQQGVFQILDAETEQPISNVEIYQAERAIATSNSEGFIYLKNESLPNVFWLKSTLYETESIQLFQKNELTILYLKPVSHPISEIVLYSTLIPTRFQKVPASINLITTLDFQRNDATNILENFKNIPGVFINQGGLNTNKINIRGIGARSQYSTNRIQAYFDGIPLATAEGELTLDDFDQETLDRIEVIKGPSSSIFGAGLGGSINLFSKNSNKKETRAKVGSQFGSFNTNKNVFQFSTVAETSSHFATLSNLTSDGYRDNGNYKRNSALVNGQFKIAQSGKLSYLANFTTLKAFIPSSINKEDFENNPSAADFAWEQSQGYESYDRGLIGVSYAQPITVNLKNTTSIFYSFKDAYEPRPFDILEEKVQATSVRSIFNLKATVLKVPSEISFGASFYKEWYQTGNFKNLYKDFPNKGSIEGARISENKQDRNYANYFAQINLDLTKKWNLETGFNINSTSYSLADLYILKAVNQSGHYQFKTIFSPRIGTSYEIAPSKNIFANVSYGFSTPTVAETLTPEGQINTNLKPEIGINFEMGFKGNWFKNKLYTEISTYSIQIENLLVAQRVAEDQYVGINAGKTVHNGIEFMVNYQFNITPSISAKPYISSAFNFFKFKNFNNEDQDFSGNKLPGVPNYTLNVGADLKIKNGLELFLNYRNVGKIFLNDSNSSSTASYQLFNLRNAYTFSINGGLQLKIYGGINNLFNEKYAASILTNAVGFGGKLPRYYYPGNPRNFYGGLQLQYDF